MSSLPQSTSLVENLLHTESCKTFPLTLNWNILGVVVIPKYIPGVHLWSKTYYTSRVARPSFLSFVVSHYSKHIPQRYISGRKPTTHRGWQHLPFDIDLGPSWCRRYTKVYSRGTSLVENLPHVNSCKILPSILTWSLRVVATTLQYTSIKTYHTPRVAKHPLRH